MYMLHYVENIFNFLKYQFRYFEKVKTEMLLPFLQEEINFRNFFLFH